MDRYGILAAAYDITSLEWPVYRTGRRAGVAALRLRPGERVLDVGCGTGLSFPLLREAVGPTGAVVGVDSSEIMLRKAQRRAGHQGWTNVTAIAGNAADMPPGVVTAGPFDAVLAVYAFSVLDGWREAWQQARALLRPGGRVVVVDLALPQGRWSPLRPAALLACWAGGADPSRHPWRVLDADAAGVSHRVLRGGHVHVVSGTVGP